MAVQYGGAGFKIVTLCNLHIGTVIRLLSTPAVSSTGGVIEHLASQNIMNYFPFLMLLVLSIVFLSFHVFYSHDDTRS